MDDLVNCTSCEIAKQRTEFSRTTLKAKNIFHCKSCCKIRNNNSYRKKLIKPANQIEPDADTQKTCSKCKVEQSVVNFQKHPLSKDGCQTICKTCQRTKYIKTGKPRGRKPVKIVKLE